MTYSCACIKATTAFLSRAAETDIVNDTTVTSSTSPYDVIAASKRIRRGKFAGPDKIHNPFYIDYADPPALFSRRFTPDILRAAYSRWCSVNYIFSGIKLFGLRLAASTPPDRCP